MCVASFSCLSHFQLGALFVSADWHNAQDMHATQWMLLPVCRVMAHFQFATVARVLQVRMRLWFRTTMHLVGRERWSSPRPLSPPVKSPPTSSSCTLWRNPLRSKLRCSLAPPSTSNPRHPHRNPQLHTTRSAILSVIVSIAAFSSYRCWLLIEHRALCRGCTSQGIRRVILIYGDKARTICF